MQRHNIRLQAMQDGTTSRKLCVVCRCAENAALQVASIVLHFGEVLAWQPSSLAQANAPCCAGCAAADVITIASAFAAVDTCPDLRLASHFVSDTNTPGADGLCPLIQSVAPPAAPTWRGCSASRRRCKRSSEIHTVSCLQRKLQLCSQLSPASCPALQRGCGSVRRRQCGAARKCTR